MRTNYIFKVCYLPRIKTLLLSVLSSTLHLLIRMLIDSKLAVFSEAFILYKAGVLQ